MKKIKHILLTIALLAGVVGVFAPSATVGAINVFDSTEANKACSSANANSSVCDASKKDKLSSFIGTIVNILLYILGAVAVIMMIIGGFMYAVSGGDLSAVTKAKNTILYAVVGLVVAVMAYAIVHFVIGAVK